METGENPERHAKDQNVLFPGRKGVFTWFPDFVCE